MADEAKLEFSDRTELYTDLGFLGYKPADDKSNGISHQQPVRGSKKNPLTGEQKAQNRQKSSVRVVIEHAIGQAKRWRIISECVRSYLDKCRDDAILICCALSNFLLKVKMETA